jgi:sugar phosphate isomerase/epimerase
MSNVSRRGFLAGGAGLAAGALVGGASSGVTPASAADKTVVGGLFPPERIGLQLYSVADQVSGPGFAKTLEELAKIGFKRVEFAGYTQGSTPEITLKQLRQLLDDNGLEPIGSHVSPSDDESMKRIIEEASILRIPNVGISLPLPTQGPTAAGWTALSQEYNRYGEMAAKQGIGFYLHNHFHEWLPTPDDPTKRGEDVLLAETDPRYVFFEMDIYWSYVGQWQSGQILQFDPLHDYAIPHRDRYKFFHVKDGKKDVTGGFTDALNDIVDAGQGNIDFQGFFDTLFAQSPDEVDKHWYIWERDTASSHPRGSLAAARASYAYIRYGLVGKNAPVAENRVQAAVVEASAKRLKAGRRVVRITIESDGPVSVAARAYRDRKTFARKTTPTLEAGRHTIEFALPRSTPAGRARIGVVFTGPDGVTDIARVPLVVPARSR